MSESLSLLLRVGLGEGDSASSATAESSAVSKSLRRDCPANKGMLEVLGKLVIVSFKAGVLSGVASVCVPIDLSGSSDIAAKERGRVFKDGLKRLNVSRVVGRVEPPSDILLLRPGRLLLWLPFVVSMSMFAGRPLKKDGTPSPFS